MSATGTDSRQAGAPGDQTDRRGVLPLRATVVFPGAVVPILVGRDRSRALVAALLDGDEARLVVTSTRSDRDEPAPSDLAEVGTLVRIVQVVRFPDGNFRLVVRGEERVAIGPYTQTHPFLRADVTPLISTNPGGARVEALQRNVTASFARLVQLTPYLSDQQADAVAETSDPGDLADAVAGALDLDLETRQDLLETLDVEDRLTKIARITAQELEIVEVGTRIKQEVASELEQGRREAILRRQMAAIRRELGEGDDDGAEIEDLRRRLDGSGMPDEARKEADRELGRLERLPAGSQEHHVIRTYLDWMLRFPWTHMSADSIDIAAARGMLDADHHGLEKVKERILEHLAVRSLKGDVRGPILLLVGAPGVGKTSLGRSVATAMGREFVRISLGGVRDEAEIRGHRRTYVGAMPGRIVQALTRAGTRNPVVMLDEVDKIGADYRGDPAAALLELLDPEQNHDFRDHYLDVPVDLSQVLFVGTANVVHTIPGPLLDRLEIVELPGYTVDDKVSIASAHLVAKQLAAHGLDDAALQFTDDALELIASAYTREAGVRSLDRRIAAIVRKVARRIVEDGASAVVVGPDDVREMLGKQRYRSKLAEEADEVGLVAGLAVTGTGGDVLFVETSLVPGSGKVTTTGQLGDIMRESAQAAVTYVRSRSQVLGIPDGWWEERDIHMHVPEGAVPKDGPSAGVTLTTALASAATGRAVHRDVAMTGEVTLRGKVLPIGGLREKLVAAHRAGMRQVVIPVGNESDLDDVPDAVTSDLTITPVSHMDEVLAIALRAPI